jgi:hypothetical protein
VRHRDSGGRDFEESHNLGQDCAEESPPEGLFPSHLPGEKVMKSITRRNSSPPTYFNIMKKAAMIKGLASASLVCRSIAAKMPCVSCVLASIQIRVAHPDSSRQEAPQSAIRIRVPMPSGYLAVRTVSATSSSSVASPKPSLLSAPALSVFSQVNSGSERPKWP